MTVLILLQDHSQLHQLAPLHESIHHAQGHSLAIKLGTAKNCPCSCASVGLHFEVILTFYLDRLRWSS